MTTTRTKHSAESDRAAVRRELEGRLGRRFLRPELLELALTHRSHTYEARNGVPAVILPAHPEQRDQRNAPGTDNEQLANAAEAVLAAVYLDAGKDGLARLQAIAERYLVKPELEAMHAALAEDAGRGAMRDHKTLLQERVQAEGAGKLRYIDTAQSGPAHQRVFAVEARLENEAGERVLAAAEGSSKKEAQQRAAELALMSWSEVSQPKTRGER